MAQVEMVCTPRRLPQEQWVEAARVAASINPLNHAPVQRLMMVIPGFQPQALHLAVLTTKYWGGGGKQFTVGFLDNPPPDLRARILLHMNAWSKTANVKFVESATDPEVRISRTPGGDVEGGYWSYLGTDISLMAADKPTMMLEGFTMNTPDLEFHRVVRHETGHTMGCPHEHMRKELVDEIDPDKAISYFGTYCGWNADMVRAQVLTPIEESSLWGTAHADPYSIMCYQLPGTITKNGVPIVGGLDISDLDYSFIGQVYPLPKAVV